MYITVDEHDSRPLYRQIVDEIKSLIAQGELREGSTLPPVRQVSADLGVNLNTVAFAYRKLQEEGLIRIKHGSGAVVASQTLAEKPEEQMRLQLRMALTQLVLAGVPPAEIRQMVSDELRRMVRD